VKRLLTIGLLGLVAAASCAESNPRPPADAAAPDVLEVRCDGETTEVLTPAVRAQSDGVHVLVHNELQGERLSVTTETAGDGASPGDTSLLFPIQPGPSRIRCQRESEDNAMENGDWGMFLVIEPPGWISPSLECHGTSSYHGIADFAQGARGVDDPLADSVRHFQEQEGEVVQAGYATPTQRTFVLIRDDVAVAGLEYWSDGAGGWLQKESSGCSD
jgi:hypothetical protein